MATQPQSGIVQLGSLVEQLLKIGGLFYAAGFLVILLHTARFNVPVIEALHFQNILAGWPVGAIATLAYLSRSVIAWPLPPPGNSRHKTNWKLGLLIVGLQLVGLLAIWFVIRPFMQGQSLYLRIVITISALALGNCVSLFQARTNRFSTGISVFRSIVIVLAFFLLAAVYTIWLYPRIPQSFGGGRPAQVRLFFKAPERSLLDASGPSDDHDTAPETVYLYYRTSDFMLVSKEQSSEKPLVQIPLDQIHALVWLQSHSMLH